VDISAVSPDFSYTTADNLGVLPINPPQVVDSVGKALGYDLDAVFSLKAANGHEWHGAPFPMPLAVRECLSRYLDLTSAPRRSDLKLLANYATDKLDRQVLLRLASKDGKAEYKEKITEGYVGICDLLQLCPSLQIPLEHLCSICHWLLPRYYTIASSSLVHPQSIHLTVAVTQNKRSNGRLFEGVCSTHLAKRQAGTDTVRIIVRPSTFRLPSDTSKPILMIGPGTGIAPMRALIQERVYQKAAGRNILYFGCKREDLDYLYQDELMAWQANGALDLNVAFSRANPTTKEYVQHLLQRQASETYDLIHRQGAYIYVCGGVKMGHDVTETLKQLCVEHGEMSFDQAKDYLAKLAGDGRFVQELWA
jgi:NADPH-ferrihemoprotein reductase